MKKHLHEHRHSEACCPRYGHLTMTENVQGFHLEFPRRLRRRQTSGTFLLPPGLTDYLRNFIAELLQDVSLRTMLQLWFMLDCAPQHFLLEIREFLNNVFPEQWIGRLDRQHGLLVPLI